MYSLELPSGQSLHFPPEVQFQFELQNSIFTGSGTDSLPGSFSFPLTLPATGHNRAAFNLPHLPTSANPVRKISGVWVLAHHVRMFYGDLTLRKAGEGLEVSIVANPLASLKTTALNELDLGGDRPFGTDDAGRRALMTATANDPEAHDFAFPMIYAPLFWGEPPAYVSNPNYRLINRFDRVDHHYALDGGPVVPMARLDYVLRQIVENGTDGWQWRNDWQLTNELRRLYCYNHYDLHDDLQGLQLPDTFDLRNHVSSTKASDFLKKTAGTFCLGIFTNIFSREIKLRPIQSVLDGTKVHDWTAHAISGPDIGYSESGAPQCFLHPPQSGHRTFGDRTARNFNIAGMPRFRSRDELELSQGTIPDGHYYVELDEAVYLVRTINGGGGQYKRFQRRVREKVVFGDGPELTAPMDTLLSYEVPDGVYDFQLPEWRGEGNYIFQGSNGEWERQDNGNPDALFFYRGMQPGPPFPEHVPYSSVTEDLPDGGGQAPITTNGATVATAQRSLLWPGENGLYQKSFSRWHNMLTNGRPVTYRLLLPIHELTAFSFEDKIRIANMDYFATRLRVQQLTAEGKFLVEASLFSTI